MTNNETVFRSDLDKQWRMPTMARVYSILNNARKCVKEMFHWMMPTVSMDTVYSCL